jgi:DNA modification methylase
LGGRDRIQVKTTISIINGAAQDMGGVTTGSVDLIVTSPPYPMIEMWDATFAEQDARIGQCLEAGRGREAFDIMHALLDAAWDECDRVLKPGGLACINIGDATRTIDGDFQLYSNHSRVLRAFLDRGYAALPDILWRKPNNAPTKFLGSGMLPVGAYVTYEHEYILILRKGARRRFSKPEEKELRRESAFFWEERNVWFSDVWHDIKGAAQALVDTGARERSAAFPFELAYRLICMFSIKQDTVLDPFVGTGTTLVAALATGRNAIGVEIDSSLARVVHQTILNARDFANTYSQGRLSHHMEFVESRIVERGPLKYTHRYYGFPVMTSQERDILISDVEEVAPEGENVVGVTYAGSAMDDSPHWPTEEG